MPLYGVLNQQEAQLLVNVIERINQQAATTEAVRAELEQGHNVSAQARAELLALAQGVIGGQTNVQLSPSQRLTVQLLVHTLDEFEDDQSSLRAQAHALIDLVPRDHYAPQLFEAARRMAELSAGGVVQVPWLFTIDGPTEGAMHLVGTSEAVQATLDSLIPELPVTNPDRAVDPNLYLARANQHLDAYQHLYEVALARFRELGVSRPYSTETSDQFAAMGRPRLLEPGLFLVRRDGRDEVVQAERAPDGDAIQLIQSTYVGREGWDSISYRRAEAALVAAYWQLLAAENYYRSAGANVGTREHSMASSAAQVSQENRRQLEQTLQFWRFVETQLFEAGRARLQAQQLPASQVTERVRLLTQSATLTLEVARALSFERNEERSLRAYAVVGQDIEEARHLLVQQIQAIDEVVQDEDLRQELVGRLGELASEIEKIVHGLDAEVADVRRVVERKGERGQLRIQQFGTLVSLRALVHRFLAVSLVRDTEGVLATPAEAPLGAQTRIPNDVLSDPERLRLPPHVMDMRAEGEALYSVDVSAIFRAWAEYVRLHQPQGHEHPSGEADIAEALSASAASVRGVRVATPIEDDDVTPVEQPGGTRPGLKVGGRAVSPARGRETAIPGARVAIPVPPEDEVEELSAGDVMSEVDEGLEALSRSMAAESGWSTDEVTRPGVRHVSPPPQPAAPSSQAQLSRPLDDRERDLPHIQFLQRIFGDVAFETTNDEMTHVSFTDQNNFIVEIDFSSHDRLIITIHDNFGETLQVVDQAILHDFISQVMRAIVQNDLMNDPVLLMRTDVEFRYNGHVHVEDILTRYYEQRHGIHSEVVTEAGADDQGAPTQRSSHGPRSLYRLHQPDEEQRMLIESYRAARTDALFGQGQSGLTRYADYRIQQRGENREGVRSAYQTWAQEGAPELGVAAGDPSLRAQMLFLRRTLLPQHHQMRSFLLAGLPESARSEAPLPIHVEVHSRDDRKPQGVIYLIPDYGETTALYEEIVDYYVDQGFAVVIADQRGHGLSGHIFGIETFMDSGHNMVSDALQVLHFIQTDDQLKNLHIFGLGVGQGATWHTILAQENQGVYAGLSMISPRHHSVQRPQDYSPLSFRHQNDIFHQHVTHDRNTSLLDRADRFVHWGIIAPNLFRHDAIMAWQDVLEIIRANGTLNVRTLVTYGAQDMEYRQRGLDVTRELVAGGVQEHVIQGQNQRILYEGGAVNAAVLGHTTEFFTGIIANPPPPRGRVVVPHPTFIQIMPQERQAARRQTQGSGSGSQGRGGLAERAALGGALLATGQSTQTSASFYEWINEVARHVPLLIPDPADQTKIIDRLQALRQGSEQERLEAQLAVEAMMRQVSQVTDKAYASKLFEWVCRDIWGDNWVHHGTAPAGGNDVPFMSPAVVTPPQSRSPAPALMPAGRGR